MRMWYLAEKKRHELEPDRGASLKVNQDSNQEVLELLVVIRVQSPMWRGRGREKQGRALSHVFFFPWRPKFKALFCCELHQYILLKSYQEKSTVLTQESGLMFMFIENFMCSESAFHS